MLELRPCKTKKELTAFMELPQSVYRGQAAHRATEDDILALLLRRATAFSRKAKILPFLAFKQGDTRMAQGRFALIQDALKPQLAQIGFFEGMEDCPELAELAYQAARRAFPEAEMVVAGLGGHLNYSAGFSLDSFDSPPAFGMPHTAPYYPRWFSSWQELRMRSYRYPALPFSQRMGSLRASAESGIRVRTLSFSRMKEDLATYTNLNNLCFKDHPLWIERKAEEDIELFLPFKPFLSEENLLFAEKDGRPIGFFLWYPDFNQLCAPGQRLGLAQLLRYRLGAKINGYRFTQIAVLPEFRASDASLRLIQSAAALIAKRSYDWGEGGFIFESNSPSLDLAQRFFTRVLGFGPGQEASGIQTHSYALYQRDCRPGDSCPRDCGPGASSVGNSHA